MSQYPDDKYLLKQTNSPVTLYSGAGLLSPEGKGMNPHLNDASMNVHKATSNCQPANQHILFYISPLELYSLTTQTRPLHTKFEHQGYLISISQGDHVSQLFCREFTCVKHATVQVLQKQPKHYWIRIVDRDFSEILFIKIRKSETLLLCN